MSFLPIVARELRGASRRRGTYWVRTLVAAIAVGTGVVIFLATLGTPAAQSGRIIFQGLSGLLLLYCLASGRALTVDCLSVEKREGTLGLLFLTDLKGYDVVLGKLVATSLNGLYALLAVMPVLAFSMLLGAVANAEFWRMVLVLADTFLLSLAIGIFCSALSRDARRASAANFALLLLLVGVLPAVAPIIDYFHPHHPLIQPLFYTCPGYSFFLSFDAPYKAVAVHFWRSVGVIHALTWLLVALTSWIVPYTWQDKTARTGKARFRDLWQAWNYGPVAGRAPFRKRMLDENAFYWLAGRARFKPLHVWTFLGLMACWWGWSVLRAGDVWWSDAIVIFTSLILNSTFKLWITLEAGQQLAEDQRMGTMELLLPTPLTARDILHGQWLALRRQFLSPIFAVIAAEIALMGITLWHRKDDHQIIFMTMAGLLALLADSYALAWVSMRRALTARSASRAAIGTVSRILILPWIGYGAIQLIIGIRNILWPEHVWEPEWRFNLALWFGLGMFADLLFGLPARHQLLRGFRRLAMHRFESKSSRLPDSPGATAPPGTSAESGTSSKLTATELARRRPWRRKAVVFGIVLVLLAAGILRTNRKQEIKYPPPVVVSITQSNTPLFITPGQETQLMLPDGSFWRWGQGGGGSQPGHDVPEQIGQGHDWVQVDCSYYGGVGLQRNGTLWAWGMAVPGRTAGLAHADFDPMPMALGNDWASATTTGSDSLAIKKDGTLWSWSNRRINPSGNGPSSAQTNAVQIGTNHDWAATRAFGNISLGLRTDGTLWTWGQIYALTNGAWRSTQIPLPVQVCRETNWAGFEKGFSILVWTRSGELWQVPLNSPNAAASIVSNGRLIVSHSGPGRFASAAHYRNNTIPWIFFRLQDDGTLWECDSAVGSSLPGTWHQTSERSDWITIWGGGGTALGLTHDGTIWTWGTDWTRVATIPFSARWHMLQDRISAMFKPTPGGGGISPAPAYQELPRPLMRIVMTGTNPPSASVNAADPPPERH